MCDWGMRGRDSVRRRLARAGAARFENCPTPLLREAARQLDDSFAGKRREFDLPVLLVGTPLQTAVWRELQRVQYGECATYSMIAARVGSPKSVRAVASAIGANALSVVVPCHRIIGSDGALRGYAGGIDAKKFLLRLEGAALPELQ